MNAEGLAQPARAPVRALALVSGGLDSRLAVRVLQEQGITVIGLCFDSPFFNLAPARHAARQLGIELDVVDFTADILDLIKHPPHGFGAGMNPCIDCHARMLRRAGERLARHDARFLVTGEVLNERPMSQNRRSLGIVARDSGLADLVLRPLSARLLEPTRPEREGWVDRERLLALEGRGRKPQFALAAQWGLTDYPTPAGGCRLTEPNYARRLRDLKAHEGLDDPRQLRLLRLGRHLRLSPQYKLIIGRDEADNAAIEAEAAPGDAVLSFEAIPGPVALLPGGGAVDQAFLARAMACAAAYADAPPDATAPIVIRTGNEVRHAAIKAVARAEADALRV